ncbi:IS30 family transposase [Pandoraea sp.]|uniref:IS30 family transposase n=1 Tax=Pandoraea sp. TaxID=1883445 RepID=UPI0035AF5E3A
MRTHKHLRAKERAVIMIEHRNGTSTSASAQRLRRSISTVSRELARNGNTASYYDATLAALAYCICRKGCTTGYAACWQRPLPACSCRMVNGRWLPQQIPARLRRICICPADPDQRVSHETIYAAIYAHPRCRVKRAMMDGLRQAKPGRGRRRLTPVGSGFVPEALRIVRWPEEIELRQLPGHREGDLIKGAFNRSAVSTLIERKTLFVALCLLTAARRRTPWRVSRAG